MSASSDTQETISHYRLLERIGRGSEDSAGPSISASTR